MIAARHVFISLLHVRAVARGGKAGGAPLVCAFAHSRQTVRSSGYDNDPRVLAETAFSILAKRNRSWKRLSHVVDLALTNPDDDVSKEKWCQTAVDIGTDHGLLAVALAISGKFEKVTGVDTSINALQDGAFELKEEIAKYQCQQDKPFILPSFRTGDGLMAELNHGDADVVCIAGMGVNTMIHILSSTSQNGRLMIDSLGCRKLVLQPTNTRPKNLILLYDKLHTLGWRPFQEKLEYLSGRWYLSTSFIGRCSSKPTDVSRTDLPLASLSRTLGGDVANPMYGVLTSYIGHHVKWLRSDEKVAGSISEAETRWLKMFEGKL